MEFERRENNTVKPAERIRGFEEFHTSIQKKERRNQAARCMNCGVPFCQSAMKIGGAVSGCPLHNLIPEWNDQIYGGNWEHALARLTKTSSFPEFTGRVCPALCEAACSCGLYDSPVTVRENELAIIENGFKNGLVKPRVPEVRTGKRVAVVGSGPAGLACADRLNRRGHSVTVFEKDDRIGGLLMYGIPNMKLDKSVVDRRVSLMKKEGVEFRTNADIGRDIPAAQLREQFDAVVLCCGAGKPRDLAVENRETSGVYFAVDFLKSTTKALLDNGLKEGFISAKDKNVVIVGGGDTGNDCVGTCIRHGCKSVLQLEMMPKPPEERAADNPWPQWPRVLKTDYGQQEAIAVFGGEPRVWCTTVTRLIPDDAGALREIEIVTLEPKRDKKTGRTVMKPVPGTERTVPCELLLIAAGFLGPRDYTPDAFGVARDARGNVAASDYATDVPGVFTAGDMHRGQSLVVWAIAEGRAAARSVDTYLMGYSNMV